MRRIDLAELDARAEAYDRDVLATPRVDGFCTSSAWILSAHAAFHPEQEPWIFESDDGWLVLARDHADNLGSYMAPMEAMWGLASPIVGADTTRVAHQAWRTLKARRDRWDMLWFCGIARRSAAFQTLALLFGDRHRLFLGPTTTRHIAGLEGGFDGFMCRRSAKFRANLRRAMRKADRAGVEWTCHDAFPDDDVRADLYHRCLDVDDRSWKGLTRQGLAIGGMSTFYSHMTARLAAEGRLRIVLGRLGGEDVAMGFGGVFGDTFRGLQMSFDDRFRDLALGNLVQAHLIRRLAEEGVPRYDLGTDIGYKRRWADPDLGLETVALVVRK
ncbi:MAG: GNAT family N-acetyltransferase [Myxococcota bacterium]